jgi:hypothetical protein
MPGATNGGPYYPQNIYAIACNLYSNRADQALVQAISLPGLEVFLTQEVTRMHLLLAIQGACQYIVSHNQGLYGIKWQGFTTNESSLNTTPEWALRLLAYDAVTDMKTVVLARLGVFGQ